MKRIILFVGIACVLVADISIAHFFSWSNIAPQILVIFIVYIAALRGFRSAIPWIYASLVASLMSGIPFGLLPIAYVALALLSEWATKIIAREFRLGLLSVLSLVGTWVWYVAIFFCWYAVIRIHPIGTEQPLWGTVFGVRDMMGLGIANGIGMIVLYRPLKWYFNLLDMYSQSGINRIIRRPI